MRVSGFPQEADDLFLRKRFFTSDLLSSWDRTLKLRATQIGEDVVTADVEEFIQGFLFHGMKFNHAALEDRGC